MLVDYIAGVFAGIAFWPVDLKLNGGRGGPVAAEGNAMPWSAKRMATDPAWTSLVWCDYCSNVL